MKHRHIRRRALALLLALALCLILPAYADKAASPEAPDDEILELFQEDSEAGELPVGEIEDLYAPKEAIVPEEAEAVLPESADNAIPGLDPIVQANTSVPSEDYKSQSYIFNVGARSSFTMKTGDTLEIVFPKGNGFSWFSSKSSVARISLYSDSESIIVTAASVGKSVLTLTLNTGKIYDINIKVVDPYKLTAMSLKKSSVSLLAGRDLDVADYLRLTPVYARDSFTYKSTKPSVAKVNSSGIVTGMKAGTARIVITSSNGLQKKLKVTVTRNYKAVSNIPTAAACAKQGENWSLRPRALDLLGDGSLVFRLYVLNGSTGKLKSLRNLDLSISLKTSYGENLIAHAAFSKVAVSCAKNSRALVKLTFSAKEVFYSGMKLSSLDASKLIFRLYSAPTARTASKSVAYRPTAIEVTGDPAAENPVTYRALLVSENDFYFSHYSGSSWAWEHSTRNHNDVTLMKKTLNRVKTPDGTNYSVTVKHNTSKSELNKLIQTTFADADENDVSLFFIATHGDSDDETPDDKTGALIMASQDETYPEFYYLSELRKQLLKVPGKVIVILESCGSGASIKKNSAAAAKSAQAFDAEAIALFQEADPGVMESRASGAVSNTGELVKVNKFYVLCCSEYKEESWGMENGDSTSHNFFTRWLCQGIGKSGSMPADKKYAGNRNGGVDLHELYRYVAGVGDNAPIVSSGNTYYQHVQVYPSNTRYAMFQ